MSFNWTQVPVRLLRRNAYDVAMKEYERQVTEEVSAKNRQAQIAAVAPNRGWMHHISSENNKADAYRIAWEVTMQKLQQQERQREWDAQAAQNQYWAKTQEKAQSSLAKTGEMLNLDPLARQRRIAEETYRLASQDAQSKGDFETAQEYERRMRLAMGDKTSAIEQATPEDLSSGLVKRTVEQGPAQPQGALSRYAQYAEEKDPQRVASMKALGQKASAFKDELLSPETRQEAVADWKQSKRGEFMFSAGVGGIMQSLGGALEAYGKNGQWLVDAGTRIQAEATRGLPEAKNKGEQMSDAIWSSAPFLVGAMGLAAGGMQAAAAMGLGTVGTWLIGSLLGTAASRPFESVTEGGQAYLEAKNRGASQEVAKEAYDSVLKGNMRLAGWDAVQIAVAFAPMPAKILGKAASPLLKTLRIGSKVAIVGLTEGGEEVYQDMLQKKAQGDPFYWNPDKWDDDTKLAFAVGTIMGIGFGAGGDVLTVGPEVRAIAPETFDTAHDSAVAEGKSEDIAVAEAIMEVAKENPQAVEAIIPAQQSEQVAEAAPAAEPAPSVEKQGTGGKRQPDVAAAQTGIPISLTAFHGTTASFDVPRLGGGPLPSLALTTRQDVANTFGVSRRKMFGGQERLLAVDVDLKNPLVIDAQGRPAADWQFGKGGEELARLVREGNHDAVILRNTKDGAPSSGIKTEGTADVILVLDQAAIVGNRPVSQEGTTVPTQSTGIERRNPADVAALSALETTKQMLEDNIATRVAQKRDVPAEWRRRLNEVNAQLVGAAPGEIVTDASYMGHPQNAETEPGMYGLVPLKVNASTDFSWRIKKAAEYRDTLQQSIGKAEYEARTAKGTAKKRAQERITSTSLYEQREQLAAITRTEQYLYQLQDEVRSLSPETGVTESATTQTEQAPDTSGQIIGGVEAYDPMRGMFEYDPTESIKRLFPESNIGKITQAAGKLPFGEEAVGFFNPTLTPRESLAAQTVQEHGAVANDLVYRVASGRKAYIGNLAKSLFPEGDAVKHFQVDDIGIQHAFKAKREGAPMGIDDVLANPQNYELDAPAKELVKLWRKVHSQAITELDKRGIKVNQKFYEEGGGYFPRMVRSAYGEEVNVPRVKYRKPRSFATQEEGIYNEIGYTIDPIHNINGFIDETFRIIAAHDLKQVVDSVGRTAKDSVPVSLRIARDEAVKRHKVMLRAYSAAQRAKRGEKLPSATIRSIEGIDEAAARLVEGKDTKALKAMVDESRRLAIRARKDYSVALEKARGPKLGSFERGTIHPAFKGQWFSEETAKVLDALAPKAASDAWRRVQSVNEAMRTVKANFDFSPATIQGLNVLARAPHKWGEVTAKSFEWLFKPENAPKWFAKHGDIISRHPDIVQGTHEYYAGQEVIKTKLGKPGRAIAKAMTPFENYFTNWGDAARVLMAEALEPSFVKAGTPERLGTYINRMTGVMDTRALGVSGKQRAFESLMLFAPRYTRASVAYIGTAMEGGVMGAEARKTIALLIGAGTLFWMGMQKAMGEEPAWPNSPNFWTVKMGNRRVGMGGFMYSFIRLLADSYQSIASEGGNAPSDFKEWDRTNPIINFLSKRTSVLWRAVLTVRDETDFMGYPIEGFDEWAHYFMVEMMAPISIQEQLTGANEDAPSNRLGVAAAELFGLRTFPENEYYALADKYAQAAYGKDWNELSKPTKAGSYTRSPEQKRLLQMHPDLKAAYDAQKDRASERWKAQHDLLGDKNISRDAWAREMFGKDYKDLPKEYQKQVDEAIARG